jgi:hypothetical protein
MSDPMQSVTPAVTEGDDGRRQDEEASVFQLPAVDNTPSVNLEPTDRELLLSLHAKLDYLHSQNVSVLSGLQAVHGGVAHILQLLAGVQQVAAMMPGKIGKAVREMASNPPNGVSP